MSNKPAKESNLVLTRKFDVPIQLNDLSIYDGAFTSRKQRFAAEMRRMEEEMIKFSKDLLRLNGQMTTVQAGMTSSDRENPATSWDAITKSPLVEGEGDHKMLKLQFDVSHFDPNEVSVMILNNILIVSAAHQEQDDTKTAYSKFNREFQLPNGTDPEAVESSLSKDGVLTVRAPIHLVEKKLEAAEVTKEE